ncbi:hypothetical protein K439DRAFT_1616724 [Ramaria rubella]|nr:hypothetical protein K439DRAFT_1616724 [Ramaria rubella]
MAGGIVGASSDESVISGNTELHMQKGIVLLQTGIHTSIKSVVRAFHVKYRTFKNRYLGKHKPPRAAHRNQQLLKDGQEAALISWCKYRAKQGEALTCEALH